MDTQVNTGTTPRSLNKSCSECTRRKIKCDGARPCGICSTFNRASGCIYKPRSRRQTASKDAYEQAVKRADTFAEVLEGLFPHLTLAEVVRTPRDELFSSLAAHQPQSIAHPTSVDSQAVTAFVDSGSSRSAHFDDSTTISDAEGQGQERRWDEPASQSHGMRVADDVNAINLATNDQPRSYLGVASMRATLNAIFKLCPCTKHHLASRPSTSRAGFALSDSVPTNPRDIISTSSAREQRCIDFYFDTVHGITPLLDEADFRATYTAGQRRDGSWLALLNMVLALGAISSGITSLHAHFYNQARPHLSFECLASGNLDSLQALCLLGGYYLHYVNSPNMAYAVLGAAHRMAIALGLHRDSSMRNCNGQSSQEDLRQQCAHIELRRRIWWSLFCLDTWSGMTLGRPTCGRWDAGTMDTRLPTPSLPRDQLMSSLIASSEFCLIIHRIQERLAQFNRITPPEVSAYDQELQKWHSILPEDLRSYGQFLPSSLRVARQFMIDRYINSRVMLYRCLMLYDAHDMIKTGFLGHGCEPATSPGLLLAEEAIEIITLNWTPSCFSVWSSTWYLFQACMVPLLSAAIATKMAETQTDASIAILHRCHATVNKALQLFEELGPWMKSADRGPDVIAGFNEGLASQIRIFTAARSSSNGLENSLTPCDHEFSETSWEALLADNDWLLDDTLYGV